jgi:ATP-dependent Clp protease ATP-binding subunit ClpA
MASLHSRGGLVASYTLLRRRGRRRWQGYVRHRSVTGVALADVDPDAAGPILWSMFKRFTDPARRVVVLAQEEARMLNHNYIGTEHILLGLIHEGQGVAAKALESLNISLEAVRDRVEEIIGQGQAAPTGHIPFTPRAKKIFELSFREALHGHTYIGTEHILLGLVREGEGVAAQVLQQMGIDLGRTRGEVIRRLSGEHPAAAETAGAAQSVEAARCASCQARLSDSGRISALEVQDEEGRPTTVRLLYCSSCGAPIGTVA